ncbi:MAG: 3-hydroxyacyl-ACP dehydratase FabZ family protein [Planctomycetaceae bacterium]
MRWMWVDRFTEFVSGSHASGTKNVALDEDVIDDYCPGFPYLPPTLIIEGMAQLGGILVAEMFDWDKRVVLAKVAKAEFFAPALPGDQLHYHVALESAQDNGAVAIGTSHRGGVLQARIELMFAFLEDGKFAEGPLFKPGDLGTMLRLMKMFHVAVDAEGNPIRISDKL